MRIIKLRGQSRRWKEIAEWTDQNKELDIDRLRAYHRDYVKMWVSPWHDISLLSSTFPEPSGRSRQLMLEGLVTIYNSWKNTLEKLNEPYYLKIWLYNPRFGRSQVVCTVGDFLKFYDITFPLCEGEKRFPLEQYGPVANHFAKMNWQCRIDEDSVKDDSHMDPDQFISMEEYQLNQRWMNRIRKKAYRTSVINGDEGEKYEYYHLLRGKVWVGGD